MEPQPIPPPPRRPVLRGRWGILLVAAVVAVAAAWFLFFGVLSSRRLYLTGQGSPVWCLGEIIRGATLTVAALQLVRYARALRRYDLLGDEAVWPLEAAHAAVWKWAGINAAVVVIQMGAALVSWL